MFQHEFVPFTCHPLPVVRRFGFISSLAVLLALLISVAAICQTKKANPSPKIAHKGAPISSRDYTKEVNVFVGTDGHGHTFPGATVPFGMVQLSPDTRVEGWDACSGYHYSDSTIMGFTHTHLSGTGVGDYGDILFMPTVGDVRLEPGDEKESTPGYRSRFSHKDETASPGYYSVLLSDYGIRAELTATSRVGVHRYTFPQSAHANVIVDLLHGIGPDVVLDSRIQITGNDEISGYRRSAGWAKDQLIYFDARFSKPFALFGTSRDSAVRTGSRIDSGKAVCAFVRFNTRKGEQIVVKVALSSASVEGARMNMAAEAPRWNFDSLHDAAKNTWNAELGKIDVAGGTQAQTHTFYSALYHAMIAPNLFSDVDGKYRGMDDSIHTAKGFDMYTVFSLWDTFRAEHPLMTIIDHKRANDFVNSLLQKYRESGVLPVWELASNETWCMIGYHSVPVIYDAIAKGLTGINEREALEAMKHSAEMDHFGLKAYREFGYVPAEMESESVSKTLEYSYDDWCISRVAHQVGTRAEEFEFNKRAQSYRNLYDPSTGFMRAKANGSWVAPFNPASVNINYTEANAWQYSFMAPQDIDGLIELHGGKEKFAAKLDSLFDAPVRTTGREQADITGMIGQYAQGNEPSHHVAYLYNYAGVPWKTQAIVRKIMDSLYTDKPDGLCGNDDCGQMSAWYVMSALGLYQVTPGIPQYCIGSPLFEKASIKVGGGRSFVVEAKGVSYDAKYIQSASLDGIAYKRSYVDHEVVMAGKTLTLVMGAEPNRAWAASDQDCPQTELGNSIILTPVVTAAARSFTDSMSVTLSCGTPGVGMFYTTDGTEPNESSALYTTPLVLRQSSTIKAMAASRDVGQSGVVTASYVKRADVGKIFLHTACSPQYTGGGDEALIDGIKGSEDFHVGSWQGYEGVDLDATVDLGMPKSISKISLGCLQDNPSWIFFPSQVEFSFSNDSASFAHSVVVRNDVPEKDETPQRKEFSAALTDVTARYIHVRASNITTCPPWHRGAGGKAWLFVDELTIEAK